jgi:hypothetical protein
MTQRRTLSYSSCLIIVASTFYLTVLILPRYGTRKSGNKVRDNLRDSGTNNVILLNVFLHKEDAFGINLNYSGYGSVTGFRDQDVTDIEPRVYLTKQLRDLRKT